MQQDKQWKCAARLSLAAVAMILTACALEESPPGKPAPEGAEYGEHEQALDTRRMKFRSTATTGVTPVPPVMTEVVTGMLGWTGSWIDLPFGGQVQETVFRTSTLGGSKTGRADLWWATVTLPADGTYRLDTTDAPIRVRGFTKVKGKGNALTSIDATSEAHLYVYLSVGDTLAYSDSILLGRDETRSEERTKSFYKSLPLPDGLAFSGLAGQKVQLFVRMESDVWANADGAAELGIKELGIPAVSAHDLVWIEQ